MQEVLKQSNYDQCGIQSVALCNKWSTTLDPSQGENTLEVDGPFILTHASQSDWWSVDQDER